MRVTCKASGAPLWLDDDRVVAIASVPEGTQILFDEGRQVTEYLVTENFETVVNQVDPLLEGDTPEEIVGNLLKGVATTPVSLLRKVMPW